MSCNRCGQVASRCGCVKTCGAAPYYLDTPVCPEDHCAKIYEQQFNAAICPAVAWNVPSCGQTALVSVPGIIGASIGSYIWADTFGYFQITSFDAQRETLGITNNCTQGNASPGTQIPACTCFVVTVPPIETASTAICVAVSFTAPEINIPTDITVTTTAGLTASDTVQIGTGFYFVEAIKPNNVITIINKGSGITPGTPVIAYDANGEFQYCLSIISSNPCDADPIAVGTLLACDPDGVTGPLGAPCEAGYIPVAQADCTVRMEPAITPPICTTLISPLNLVVGTDTYDIVVESTATLVANDVLTLSGIPGSRATINTVTDATHLNITIDPSITTALTLEVGTLVCTINCCEMLDIATDNLPLQTATQSLNVAVTPGNLTATAQHITGNTTDIGPLQNTGSNTMVYIITIDYNWSGYFGFVVTSECEISYIAFNGVTSGAIGTTVAPTPVVDGTCNLFDYLNTTDAALEQVDFGAANTRTIIGSIAPGQEMRVSAKGKILAIYVDSVTVHYTQVDARITVTLISS